MKHMPTGHAANVLTRRRRRRRALLRRVLVRPVVLRRVVGAVALRGLRGPAVDDELPEADGAELASGNASGLHLPDLAGHDIQVVRLTVFPPGKCHRDPPRRVVTAGAHDGANHVGANDDLAPDTEVPRRCDSVSSVVAASDRCADNVLRHLVAVRAELGPRLVHVLAHGVEGPEVLGLNMQHHLLLGVVHGREAHGHAAGSRAGGPEDAAVGASRHHEQLPQRRHAVARHEAARAWQPRDLCRDHVEVVAAAVLASGKGNSHTSRRVGGTLANDSADDALLHDDDSLDAQVLGRRHALAAPEASRDDQLEVVRADLALGGAPEGQGAVEAHEDLYQRLIRRGAHDSAAGTAGHLHAGANLQSTGQIQPDLVDDAIQPIPAAVFAVAEGNGDSVLRVRAAGADDGAEDTLAHHNGASNPQISRSDDSVAPAEVARDGSLYVVGVAHYLLHDLLAGESEAHEQPPTLLQRVPRRPHDDPRHAGRDGPAPGGLQRPRGPDANADLMPANEHMSKLLRQTVQSVIAEVLAVLELHADPPRGTGRSDDSTPAAHSHDDAAPDPEVPDGDHGVAAAEAVDIRNDVSDRVRGRHRRRSIAAAARAPYRWGQRHGARRPCSLMRANSI
mmetsp:Transcript_30805/g.88504  ORF Transcript_30805/g.88504 Transcript_30805/m.88504 type:complete len:621 (-) Transcript_30805:17-1879(-)